MPYKDTGAICRKMSGRTFPGAPGPYLRKHTTVTGSNTGIRQSVKMMQAGKKMLINPPGQL